MEKLSVETVYFEAAAHPIHFRSLRMMCGCLPIQGKTAKHTWGKKRSVQWPDGKIAITEIYQISVFILYLNPNHQTTDYYSLSSCD
jgi:hypothetical protein